MGSAGIGDRVEGLHAVRAAVETGRVIELVVDSKIQSREDIRTLILRATESGGIVSVVDDFDSAATTDVPQGVLARARPIRTLDIGELVRQAERPALIILDHLTDPHNVGAIARTAAATSMSGLVVGARRAAPFSGAAFKAAAGAFERLPVAVVNSTAEALERLAELDVWTVGLSSIAERSVLGLELLAEPVAIVIGAEDSGLTRLVSERVDLLAHIPMAEATESLNASVAAAIGMYEIMRLRGGSE